MNYDARRLTYLARSRSRRLTYLARAVVSGTQPSLHSPRRDRPPLI